MAREAKLQDLLDRLAAAFAEAEVSPPGRAALSKVFTRLQTPADANQPKGEYLPVTALLEAALRPLTMRGDSLSPLAAALANLAPDLAWVRRAANGPNASPGFAEAHANAMLIGPQGLERRADVQIGLSLMAPHTRYPDHDHPPEEVYLVLSEGAFLQTAPPWLPRGPGQTVYNPPGILHAMRAGEQPFLALWCLPV